MLSGQSVRRSAWKAAGGGSPTVSADGTGYTNSRGIGGDCWVGLEFNTDGEEYRILAGGATSGTSQGTWLDSGSASDVWVEFLYSSGSAGQWDGFSNSTRYQLNVTRTFRIDDTTINANVNAITGQFRFWDAASGGNILDTTTASQEWIADYEEACPMCCFTPWTLITMADGSTRQIASVRAGDLIRVENGIETVTGIIVRETRDMYLIKFEDNRIIEASDDHPFFVEGKGFSSLAPDPRVSYKDLGVPNQLMLGDRVTDVDGRTNKIVAIERIDYPDKVYTLENSRFFANGMLVY
jgi:hypothetical protein